MFFYKDKSLGRKKLILDLESSQIRLVVASIGKDGRMYSERVFQSENIITSEADFSGLWRKISILIRRAVEDYKKSGLKAEEALVVFSSPWYFSKVRSVEKKTDSPVLVTKKYIDDIFGTEIEIFKKEISSEFVPSERDLDSIRLSIMNTKLNGYTVEGQEKNLIGKSVKAFFASVYVSVFFGEAVDYIKKLFGDFGIAKIEFQTSPWIIFDTLISEKQDDILVIDIGGEITEAIGIGDGRILKMTSFVRGFNHIVRSTASSLNADLEETEDILKNYVEKKLEEKFKEMPGKALKESIQEWQNLLTKTLEKHEVRQFMPEKTIVTGPVESVGIFESIMPGSQKRDLMKFYLSYIND